MLAELFVLTAYAVGCDVKPGTVELKGARLKVPIEDWTTVRRLAPILLGLTPSGSNERACAAWALGRAAALVPALREEASRIR